MIYIYREAETVCVSMYHFLSSMRKGDGGVECSLDQFVDRFCAGQVFYGLHPEHVALFKGSSINDILFLKVLSLFLVLLMVILFSIL